MSQVQKINSIEAYELLIHNADSIEAYVKAVRGQANFIEISTKAIKIISALHFRYPTIVEYFMEGVAERVMKERESQILYGVYTRK